MRIAKIGIDTGVKTGIAISVGGSLQRVDCMTITKAMQLVSEYPAATTKLYIEDARHRRCTQVDWLQRQDENH